MDETRSAQALRESEELFRITLLNMSDAVFITNDEGRFTFVCPNADVIFGYSADDVRAMSRISVLFGRDLITPEEVAEHGEIQNIEHEIQTKGGTSRALLIHVKRVSIRGGTILYVCRDVTDRKHSERELRRNEERLKLALEAASAGTWDWDLGSGEMEWSPETHRLFGGTASDRPPTFDAFLERIHPSDRDRVARTMTQAMEQGTPYETEFRAVGYDDVERWVMGKGKATRNGKPLRMLGVFVDLTERHQVAEEMRELGGRLINAHEQERMRLSRELHDDVSQRVAIICLTLNKLQRRLPAALTDVREGLVKLTSDAEHIADELHRFSHELHPAKLQHLGLEESVRSLCEELQTARGISIDVHIDGLPGELSAEVALCFYRITQEALHNVVKHSGAHHSTLHLRGDHGEVVLKISDDGVGFDPSTVRHKNTLGLVSMQERARLVNGRFIVSSKPLGGTLVEVRVPVDRLRNTPVTPIVPH
jgi:PAS domain S-box-containing protein